MGNKHFEKGGEPDESLSDKIQDEYGDRCCKVEDVKESVQKLRDELLRPMYGFPSCSCYYKKDPKCKHCNFFNKIFGSALIK